MEYGSPMYECVGNNSLPILLNTKSKYWLLEKIMRLVNKSKYWLLVKIVGHQYTIQIEIIIDFLSIKISLKCIIKKTDWKGNWENPGIWKGENSGKFQGYIYYGCRMGRIIIP